MSLERKPTPGQEATELPGPIVYYTAHDETGEPYIQPGRPVDWKRYDDGKMTMFPAYVNAFPADLNNDADIAAYDQKMAAADGKLGLVAGGGTVLRYVDFAPGFECLMHRTQSVDFGIVVEGEIVAIMGSGKEQRMGRGDVMVQRATMHLWRNPSETEWARMIFCLQDCKPLVIGGKHFGEDLGKGTEGLPPSGNDA